MAWSDTDVEADPSLGLALCRLAMGLDELYRTTRSEGGEAALAAEGLVPVDLWRGESLKLSDWSAAADAVRVLQSLATTVADPVRGAFLEDTLLSLATTVAWQAGERVPFRARAERLLGLPIEPVATEVLASWRAEVRSARDSEAARAT